MNREQIENFIGKKFVVKNDMTVFTISKIIGNDVQILWDKDKSVSYKKHEAMSHIENEKWIILHSDETINP